MEEKLEAAYGDQKRIFLIIFQRFIMILSEHLVKCDTDGRDYNTDWYRWTIGRLQQVFLVVRFYLISMKHVSLIKQFNSFSIMNKFRSTRAHWKAFCSLRSTHTFWTFSNSSLL